MQLVPLTPQLLSRHRDRLIRFSLRHGDKRITHKALRWLKRLPLNQPFPQGTWMAVALEKDRLCGFILFGGFGLEEAFIVVHPARRRQRVGEQLLELALSRLDRIYTRVACDNIPSLKLCFSMGLVAFHLISGPTGKPTLILGGGNWTRKEFEQFGEP